MTRFARQAFALILLVPAVLPAQNSPTADAVWAQEQSYWQLVQANDLTGYRALWDDNFLGWPYSSPEPLRKPHIADWITDRTSTGNTLQSFDLQRLAIQITGDLATVTYRARTTWVDKQGAPTTGTMRIIHTWRRTPVGSWQIISGMSSQTNAAGH